jgi:hypothetical protein
LVKIGDVGGEAGRVQLDGVASGQQQGLGGKLWQGESGAEGGESDGEAVASGGGLGIGPEAVGEGVAGMGAIGDEGEVSQESGGLAGTEATDDPVGADRPELSQQLDPPPAHSGT